MPEDRRTSIFGDQIVDRSINERELDISNIGEKANKLCLGWDSDNEKFKWYSRKVKQFNSVYSVGSAEYADFSSIEDAIDYLSLSGNMINNVKLILDAENFEISDTITINLPYSLLVFGSGFGITKICASSGLTNKPMFILQSECSFTHLYLDGSTLADYGTLEGENCFEIDIEDGYCEFKDIGICDFYYGISLESNSWIWCFDSEFLENNASAIRLNSEDEINVIQIAECGFQGNFISVDLQKATNCRLMFESSYVYLGEFDSCIKYDRANVTYDRISINGIDSNRNTSLIIGFDFSLEKDANINILNCTHYPDNTPSSIIQLEESDIDNDIITSSGNIYKMKYKTPDASVKIKFTWDDDNKRLIYLSDFEVSGRLLISGTFQTSKSPRTFMIYVYKNGLTGELVGRTIMRITASQHPFLFNINSILNNIKKNDYFELYFQSTSGDNISTRLIDLYWTTELR